MEYLYHFWASGVNAMDAMDVIGQQSPGFGILARCRPEDLHDFDKITTAVSSTSLAPRSERGYSTPRNKPPRSSPLGTRGSAPAV